MISKIQTSQAPQAIGPYSQAVWAGDTLYISGQLGLDPQSIEFISEQVTDQARQALQNIQAILSEAGLTLAHVVKTTIYLADMADFSAVNDIYSQFFTEHQPARAAIQAAGLPKNARVEMEAIAFRG